MRPVLKAGLRAVWRDRDTLQIGVDPRRAVALSGMSDAGRVISLLDGSRDWAGVVAAARNAGDLGQDRAAGAGAAGGRGRAERPAAGHAERADAGGPGPDRDRAGDRVVDLRRHRTGVRGRWRGGGWRSSGCMGPVGSGRPWPGCWPRRAWARSSAEDGGPAGPQDLSPAGLGLADLDLPRADGVVRVISRIAPDVQTADLGERPDLAVLTQTAGPAEAAELTRAGIAHLAVAGVEGVAVVGPLVRPGRSACLRCLDLARSERDPAWPLILAQLAGSGDGAGTASGTAAATPCWRRRWRPRPPCRSSPFWIPGGRDGRSATGRWSWPCPTGSGGAGPGRRTPAAPAAPRPPGQSRAGWRLQHGGDDRELGG